MLDELRHRQRSAFIAARTVAKGKRRLLRVDGGRALPASAAQRDAVVDFMHRFAKTQTDPGFFRVLDVARRIAGTGSLGVDRYAILVEGKGSPDRNYLLDLTATLPSSLVARLKVAQPKWPTEAERVVTLQRRLQAVPMAWLQAVRFGEAPCVLRALQPSEDRVRLNGAAGDAAPRQALMAEMGRIVAWAQLRSAGCSGSAGADELIDYAGRSKWKAQLMAASRDSAAQLLHDAADYAAAYDDGAFDG